MEKKTETVCCVCVKKKSEKKKLKKGLTKGEIGAGQK
jgi:hypothetical protein